MPQQMKTKKLNYTPIFTIKQKKRNSLISLGIDRVLYLKLIFFLKKIQNQ